MQHRIICISIFSIFCLFGHTQLPAVAAVPFEYNEDHEQYPYDLETEQSQAKYDTRLLSQQLLKEQKASESTEQQTRHVMQNENDEEKTEALDYDDEDLQPHGRAASCYTRGHKYTHGQKVPRLDPCEVCLCMDGEIFCWWEKCEKRKFERLASTTEKSRPKHRIKAHKSAKKPPPSATKSSQPQQHKRIKAAADKIAVHENNYANQQSTKSLIKKKRYQQNKQNEFNQKQQKPAQQAQKQQQQQPQQQQHKHSNYRHSPATSAAAAASSSKILNFPENLPSVLYYDYHTEEHEHHQHQHHQQHLKHQLQKKLQSEREHQHTKHAASQLTTSPMATHSGQTGVNENAASSAYDDEALTDSDILPEPPTKKPKMTSAGQTTASTAFATMDGVTSWHFIADVGHQAAHSNNNGKADDDDDGAALGRQWQDSVSAKVDDVQQSYIGETLATSSIIARDDVVEINKNLKQHSPKTANVKNDNGKADDDDVDVDVDGGNMDDEEDDAFHRWLTSTESNKNKNRNNNNNSNINDSNYNAGNKSTAGNNEDYAAYATEISDLENPFGIQNFTISSQQNTNKHNNKNNNSNNGRSKVFYPTAQQSVQHAENGFQRGSNGDGESVGDDDGAGDYIGGVVNIDILLTTPDEPQQQQQQEQQQRNKFAAPTAQTTTKPKTEQLPRAPTSIKFAADLISHTNNNGAGEGDGTGNSGDAGSSELSAKALNDIKMKTIEMGGLSPKGLFDKENSAVTPTAASTVSPSLSSVQFIKQPSVSVKDDISRRAFDSGTSTVGTTTTMGSTRQCNVMGTLYKIGDVLPQDTGNCLQCICIDGSTSDDTPRVTCSPHNCPPLVLPDLFDATGY